MVPFYLIDNFLSYDVDTSVEMDLPSGVLDSIDISNDKDVLEVLKQTVTEEDIIFESEATEDSVETEIEEIIEIIEEVEESEEQSLDNTSLNEKDSINGSIETEGEQEIEQSHQFDPKSRTEIYSFEDENVMFKAEAVKGSAKKNSSNETHNIKSTKQVITYDVDKDWEDEEMEHMEDTDEDIEQNLELTKQRRNVSVQGKATNNQTISFPLQTNRSGTRDSDKSKLGQEYECNVNRAEIVDNSNHQIVKNENNLLYTVLGTKKVSSNKLDNAQYIKMEQLDENTIPVEGTIYYEGENMETLYVAQAVDDSSGQYQYDSAATEQEEQMWEGNSGNSDQQNPEEENSQDQIFLHEDEDGQLYFKDENGALQPVYLTEDGNYAIADVSDDQNSKESLGKSPQKQQQGEESFATQDMELKTAHGNKQSAMVPSSANDLDNEDNTVTISLIISEDEHGQKRTQVIIPTTDSLKCDICNKSFKTSFQLLRHNRLKHAREEDITTRNFPCDLCPKRYPDQNSLARHRKTHTGDRPFQCLECHKNFPTSTALRRHLTLHNTEARPLPCIYCGRRFVEKASLMKHEQSHLPGDQRNHTCDVCHKTFLHATDLSLHKKYHDPDKKFDCEVCGREFNRLNNLQRHMMVHQQPDKSEKSQDPRHEKSKNQGGNEEILSCDVCGITYKFMSSLTRHMVTTHMNPEKLRQQAEEQRRKRENNYRRYLENRKMYETQHSGNYNAKRTYHHNARLLTGTNDETA